MSETFHITNAHGALDFLRLSQARWQFAQVVTYSHIWIFRGQGDSRWPLTPKSLRKIVRDKPEDTMSLPWRALAAELDRTSHFLKLADEVGLHTVHNHDFKNFYSQLTETAEGKRDRPPDLSEDLLEAFSLAQHHGVATRLLDWSASPLTALFFAARDAFLADDKRESFAVWAIPQRRPGDERMRVVRPSFSRNQFAQRQIGYLTYDAEVDLHFDDESGWPSQDIVLDAHQKKWGNGRWPGISKIVVPSECAEEVLILLFQEGISEAHLMPTLSNTVNTLNLLDRLQPYWLKRLDLFETT